MTPACVKTSCTFILVLMVLMVLTETEGAKLKVTNECSKHKGEFEHKHMVPLQLDSSAQMATPPARALHNSSISPWTYNTTHDESLFPSSISEAMCLLKGCLNSEGQEDTGLESRPIMHEVFLLRRVFSPHSQSHYFKLERRLLTVGCTCVQPVVLMQQ